MKTKFQVFYSPAIWQYYENWHLFIETWILICICLKFWSLVLIDFLFWNCLFVCLGFLFLSALPDKNAKLYEYKEDLMSKIVDFRFIQSCNVAHLLLFINLSSAHSRLSLSFHLRSLFFFLKYYFWQVNVNLLSSRAFEPGNTHSLISVWTELKN